MLTTHRASAVPGSTAKPVRLLLILGSLAAIGPASMDIYLPALPGLADEFRSSASAAQLTVATFLVGLGAGQLVAGPLSDVFGRRRPMLIAIVIYTFATLACAAAPSIELLVPIRFVQGGTAAAGIVIARAVVRDLYASPAGARYLSRLVLIYGLAPVLAPLIGGQLLRFTSWRGVFFLLAAMAVVLLVATAMVLPETLSRAQRRDGSLGETGRTFRTLLRRRTFLGYLLTLGFGSAAVIGYVAGSPFVLQEVYGVSPQLFGVFFGLNAVAMIASSQVNAHLVTRLHPRRLLLRSIAAMIVVGLLLVGSVVGGLGLWAVAPCLVALMGTWGFVPANAIALAMADHPEVAGSASALLGLFQFGVGALAAPLVGLGGTTTALPMALVVLVLGVLAAVSARVIARPSAW